MPENEPDKAQVSRVIAEFKAKVLAHPILKAVRTGLLEEIRTTSDQPIHAVVGPTGVGKTTLSENFAQEILLQEQERMRAEPGYIPIARVEVAAPEMSRFDWGGFYKDAMEKLKEPMIERKGTDLLVRGPRKSLSDLRRAFENCLRNRKTHDLLADEAQHLTRVPHGRHLKDQMETIKSLASRSKVRILLIGTYELLDLLSLNGQTARRTGVLHFRRYRYESGEELRVFQNIMGMFQSRLPIPVEPPLIDQAEMIYLRTLGCVGLLKDWLTRALRRALTAGDAKLTTEHLLASAHPAASLKTMAEEIREGESRLAEELDAEESIRLALGMPAGDEHREGGAPPAPRRAVRVGERAPIRDKVGACMTGM
jgi:hypothetical protein